MLTLSRPLGFLAAKTLHIFMNHSAIHNVTKRPIAIQNNSRKKALAFNIKMTTIRDYLMELEANLSKKIE
jgi:hypothetical protein